MDLHVSSDARLVPSVVARACFSTVVLVCLLYISQCLGCNIECFRKRNAVRGTRVVLFDVCQDAGERALPARVRSKYGSAHFLLYT